MRTQTILFGQGCCAADGVPMVSGGSGEDLVQLNDEEEADDLERGAGLLPEAISN